jgi:hypothetical protein
MLVRQLLQRWLVAASEEEDGDQAEALMPDLESSRPGSGIVQSWLGPSLRGR